MGWKAQGLNIAWVTLMLDDPNDKMPATPGGAKVWKDKFGLVSAAVVADPQYSMIPKGGGSFGTPAFTIVNPRDMSVFHRQEGAGGHDQKILQLAQMNKDAEGG